MEMLAMLMASFWSIWHGYVKYIVLAIMAICAIFIILVVLFQPGNSSGVSALGGQSETFLSKNKSKTFEHKMKKLTVVASVVFAILCIGFAIVFHFVGF
ncbi:MAG: preprotein translocase subunit SecG [Clostridiales bacterium]|nr:preprotein translocase subunit SecG [Clostridiales bacterium]